MSQFKRPATIEDLEAILNSEDDRKVEVRPDGSVVAYDLDIPDVPWPDPTPNMLADPKFNAIWDCIKRWDISVPGAYGGYCGATGNHVRAILDALASVPS